MNCNTFKDTSFFSTLKKIILIGSAVLISYPVLGMETDKYSLEPSVTVTTALDPEAVVGDEIAVKGAAVQHAFSTDAAPDASSTFAGSIDFVAPEPIDELISIAEGRLPFFELSLQQVNAGGFNLDRQEALQNHVSHFRFIIGKLNEIKKKDGEIERKIEISALYVLIQCALKFELMEFESCNSPQIRAEAIANGILNADVYKEMVALLERFDILNPYKKFHCNFCFELETREVYFKLPILPKLALCSKDINEKIFEGIELQKKQKLGKKQKAKESRDSDPNSPIIKTVFENYASMINSFNKNTRMYAHDFKDYELGFDFIKNVPPFAYELMSQALDVAADFKEIYEYYSKGLANLENLIQNEQNLKNEKRQEKERVFKEEQAGFRRAYEERVEARRVKAERLRAEAEARERDMGPVLKSAATTAAVVAESLPSAPRVKIKTRKASASATTSEVAVAADVIAAPAAIPEIPSYIQELVEQTREADFDVVQALLTTRIAAGGLGAQCTPTDEGFKFAFNSPVTDKYIVFYVHKPHGAQLEKGVSVGWRKNMRAAFIRAGMVSR